MSLSNPPQIEDTLWNPTSSDACAALPVPARKVVPPWPVLRHELELHVEATTQASAPFLSDCRGRLADFLVQYPDPQTFFDLPVPTQLDRIQTQLPTSRLLSKIFAFLWFQDYARPTFELLWTGKSRAAHLDTKKLLAAEFEAFRTMARQIGYSAATTQSLENRVVELFLVSGKRRLAQLTFEELEVLHARVDKALTQEQGAATVMPFTTGVTAQVRWTLRGVSKVLMALGLPGFAQPLKRRFAREYTPLEEYFAPITNSLIRASLVDYCRKMTTVRRPGTINIYRRALFDFAWYIQTHFPTLQSYAELQRMPHITGWLQHVSERHTDNQLAVSRAGQPRPKLSMEGQRKVVLYIAAFLHRLALWEHPNAPTRVLFDKDDVPQREEPLPFALEDWQAQQIIEAAHQTRNLLGKVATLLLLRTGMRMGELLLLEITSFVRRKDPVSGREVTWIRVPIIKLGQGREVPLAFHDAEQAVAEWNAHRPFLPPQPHPRTGQMVTFWLAGGKGYGSPGQPMSYVAILNALDQVVEEAGLNPKAIWPHRYRHTLGTLLINQPDVKEATVSTLLGHGPNRAMTARYAKIKNRTLLKDMEKLHETLDNLFTVDETSPTRDIPVESPQLHELRLVAQKAWRDQGYCYCTRSPNTFCVAEESCLKCELAAFKPYHISVLKCMAADAEGKGQIKRLTLIVTALQKAQPAGQPGNNEDQGG
jgi:integrase